MPQRQTAHTCNLDANYTWIQLAEFRFAMTSCRLKSQLLDPGAAELLVRKSIAAFEGDSKAPKNVHIRIQTCRCAATG